MTPAKFKASNTRHPRNSTPMGSQKRHPLFTGGIEAGKFKRPPSTEPRAEPHTGREARGQGHAHTTQGQGAKGIKNRATGGMDDPKNKVRTQKDFALR